MRPKQRWISLWEVTSQVAEVAAEGAEGKNSDKQVSERTSGDHTSAGEESGGWSSVRMSINAEADDAETQDGEGGEDTTRLTRGRGPSEADGKRHCAERDRGKNGRSGGFGQERLMDPSKG